MRSRWFSLGHASALSLLLLACGESSQIIRRGTDATGGGGAGASGAGGVAASAAVGADAGDAAEGGAAPTGCDPSTGSALSFKGDVIDLMVGDLGPDLPTGNAARTVEVWAYFVGDASWTPNHTVVELGRRATADNQVFGLDLAGRDGDIGVFGPYTNNLGDNDPTPVTMPATGWNHLAWGYDGAGHFQLVVNGVLIPLANPGDGTGVLDTTPGIITLGGSQTFGWEGWEGVMDELRVWRVFRSDLEIARDMKLKLAGTEPGLVAYYDFDKGYGMTADDVLEKPGHKLTLCTDNGGPCPSPNNAVPAWVASDIPGPFSCAE